MSICTFRAKRLQHWAKRPRMCGKTTYRCGAKRPTDVGQNDHGAKWLVFHIPVRAARILKVNAKIVDVLKQAKRHNILFGYMY